MRRMVIECDGCGKPLEITKEHIDNKKNLIYHKLSLSFRSFFKDPNTGQEEEVSNMAKQTDNVYCNECFSELANYMEAFIRSVSPDENNLLRTEFSEDIEKNQSNEIDGLEALKAKNGGNNVSGN